MLVKDYISLDYDKVEAETELAYCLAFPDIEPVWIPKSLIDPEFLPLEESGGEVSVEVWKAEQEDLLDFAS
jgi:hypothetical protein